MSEHTPGPWLASKRSSVVGLPVVAPAADGRVICEVVGGTQADAHVIAAAPDLLAAAEALERAEDAHANCDECGGSYMPELCETCFPLFDDARIKRRKAIAKAKGDTDAIPY